MKDQKFTGIDWSIHQFWNNFNHNQWFKVIMIEKMIKVWFKSLLKKSVIFNQMMIEKYD